MRRACHCWVVLLLAQALQERRFQLAPDVGVDLRDPYSTEVRPSIDVHLLGSVLY